MKGYGGGDDDRDDYDEMNMNVDMTIRMKGMKINPKSCGKVRNGEILAVLVRE